MNNPAQDSLRAQQQHYLQMLIVLNGNRERNRIFFWVSLIVGLLMLVILAVSSSAVIMGMVIFGALEALLGIPGLIGWLRAESKIARVQAALMELERAGAGKALSPVNTAQPKQPQTAVEYCQYCGKPLIGVRAFCTSCGKQQ